MFCPECGKPNPEENQVCQFCNAMLIDNSTPAAPETSGQQTPATKMT
jgi:NMD protein affecting ribosome stability and mRNA decay